MHDAQPRRADRAGRDLPTRRPGCSRAVSCRRSATTCASCAARSPHGDLAGRPRHRARPRRPRPARRRPDRRAGVVRWPPTCPAAAPPCRPCARSPTRSTRLSRGALPQLVAGQHPASTRPRCAAPDGTIELGPIAAAAAPLAQADAQLSAQQRRRSRPSPAHTWLGVADTARANLLTAARRPRQNRPLGRPGGPHRAGDARGGRTEALLRRLPERRRGARHRRHPRGVRDRAGRSRGDQLPTVRARHRAARGGVRPRPRAGLRRAVRQRRVRPGCT